MEKNESVTITYKNDRITMKGKTFTATLSISGSELSKVYWGNEGKGTVKMVFDDAVAEKKSESAEKKSLEEPVEVKKDATVQRTTASVRKPAAHKPKASSSASDDFMKNFNK